MVICTKSSDHGMLQRGDQAACKRERQAFVRLSVNWNIKQSRTIFECNQAIKVKFCKSKILIPVANGIKIHSACRNRRYECDYPLCGDKMCERFEDASVIQTAASYTKILYAHH